MFMSFFLQDHLWSWLTLFLITFDFIVILQSCPFMCKVHGVCVCDVILRITQKNRFKDTVTTTKIDARINDLIKVIASHGQCHCFDKCLYCCSAMWRVVKWNSLIIYSQRLFGVCVCYVTHERPRFNYILHMPLNSCFLWFLITYKTTYYMLITHKKRITFITISCTLINSETEILEWMLDKHVEWLVKVW